MFNTPRQFCLGMILPVLIFSLLVSCAPITLKSSTKLFQFEEAISVLTNNLLVQIANQQTTYERFFGGSTDVKIAPFISTEKGDFAEFKKDQNDIVSLIIKEAKKIGFSVSSMTGKETQPPHYIMYGVIAEETFGFDSANKPQKHYHFYSTLVDKKTTEPMPIAREEVWIEKEDMISVNTVAVDNVSSLTNFYREESGLIAELPEKIGGQKQQKAEYDNFVKYLSEARQHFKQAKFEKARILYIDTYKLLEEKRLRQKVQISEKQIKQTYEGIIDSSYQVLSNPEEDTFVKQAYEKWFEHYLATTTGERLLTFRFQENSINFANEAETDIYPLRLRMVGNYFKDSRYCLNIIGYYNEKIDLQLDSHELTELGENLWEKPANEKLDLQTQNEDHELAKQRAKKIQEELKNYFPTIESKSTAVGKMIGEEEANKEYLGAEQQVELYVTEDCPKSKDEFVD